MFLNLTDCYQSYVALHNRFLLKFGYSGSHHLTIHLLITTEWAGLCCTLVKVKHNIYFLISLSVKRVERAASCQSVQLTTGVIFASFNIISLA